MSIEPDGGKEPNSHPVQLTPTEVATLLRGVRAWDRRNLIYRLAMGEAPKTRAFRPDISKYDRQMPDFPEQSAVFNVIFEPEEYVVDVVSGFRWWSAAQQEEVQIRYRKALPAMPAHPIRETNGKQPPPQP